ncbi:MAG: hypothetical protein C4570_03690 [Ammonifex sp.]|nr:MAG: hypothetical protein C4570_03690 [Ammonifex sp.]
MIPEPNFHPEGVRRLACAVIVQAGREALGASYLTREDQRNGFTRKTLQEKALHFLRSAAGGEEEACWFHLAGVNPEIVVDTVRKYLENPSRRWTS